MVGLIGYVVLIYPHYILISINDFFYFVNKSYPKFVSSVTTDTDSIWRYTERELLINTK